ncbi:MAG: surface carbohydrate biosynthesis protein [Vicinamibacterales bacterium]
MSGRSCAPVLLIADHKWRDLASLALLKVELEDVHGVPARIVNYTMWDAALLAFRPQIVCPTTQTGPREQRISRLTRASGARTVVIPTEGIPSAWKVMPILGCAHVDVTHVDLWFTWNDVVRDYMLEHTPLSAGQVLTTGVNRFDFYVAPLRRMLKSREQLDREYGLMPGRPIVTWATNFAHAGYALADGDFIQNDWTVRGLTTIPGYADARAYAAADLRSMIDARRMMLDMFLRFPQVNFIIKTHPAERLDLYVDYLAECRTKGAANVTLVSQEYIGNLLNSTSVLVHRYCTTGLEAWIMGIPTLGLHLKDWHADASGGGALGDAAQIDHLVTTADDIGAGLSRYLSGAGVDEAAAAARRTVLEKWLNRLDGRSTARQAAAIAALAGSGGATPRRNPFAFGPQLRGAGKRLAQMALNRALGRPFDLPLSAPATHGGVEVNALGYADRLARQSDVDAWCATLRAFRASPSAGTGR